jgi:hypothetical protein
MIGNDTAIPLKKAAEMFFPAGGVTASTLRIEAQRGNLIIIRIGRQDFVTKDAIDQMLENCKCPVQKNHHALRSSAIRTDLHPGSSETARKREALVAAQVSCRELKKNSRNTSDTNTPRQGEVVRGTFTSAK